MQDLLVSRLKIIIFTVMKRSSVKIVEVIQSFTSEMGGLFSATFKLH